MREEEKRAGVARKAAATEAVARVAAAKVGVVKGAGVMMPSSPNKNPPSHGVLTDDGDVIATISGKRSKACERFTPLLRASVPVVW